MAERVGDGALEERFGGGVKRSVRSEVAIQGLKSGEEARLFFRPRQWSGVVPALSSLHRAERPVEEVTHVGKDLKGLATAPIES